MIKLLSKTISDITNKITLPNVVRKVTNADNERYLDINSFLMHEHTIFLTDEITDDVADVIIKQLLYLNKVNPSKPISLYINSPGGSVSAGFAIIDTMKLISNPVHLDDQTAIHADALTMAFATLGLIQLFHAYNVKSVYQSIFTVGPFKSKTFNWSILVSFILLISTIVIDPLEKIFHVTKLDLSQWTVVLLGSFAMIVIVEIVKFIQRKLGMDKNAI